jgi:hypothetical protein
MSAPAVRVRDFRQILLWPVQLVPTGEVPIRAHWQLLERMGGHEWKEIDDEFTGDARLFQERHYKEFISFLPHAQRFLYGEEVGRRRKVEGYGESPMRVFRRKDVAKLHVWLHPGAPRLELDVVHIDLYFFYDLDIAILVVELAARELPLEEVQHALFRLGRAYPSFWEPDGSPGNCAQRVEWIGAHGEVLAASDFERRSDYLAYVCEHRAPRLASHWEFLLHPIVSGSMDAERGIGVRQLEYYRMPVMAYLAVDRPEELTRADFVRLAFAGPPGERDGLPYSESYLSGFEFRYCYDREWLVGPGGEPVRYLNCGHAFVAVGSAGSAYFTDGETGLLGQFRHELFLLGLIAHFHKAALLMLSDRATVAISRLDLDDPASVREFRRNTRQILETFLRFTHRYWFHEVSDQARAKDLFRMWSGHLGSERLYDEVRDEIQDMNQYLEADAARRQNGTIVRLTVVTAFGMIGTVATGFLGMNLLSLADQPIEVKIAWFMAVLVPTAALTFYAVAKSSRLSEFLEKLADERATPRAKLAALGQVWARRAHETPR